MLAPLSATLFGQPPAPVSRKEKIRVYLSALADGSITLTPAHCAAVHRALKIVWENQTECERNAHTTTQDNGVGFNGRDAAFGSDLMEKHQQYGGWSVKQVQAVAKMLRKYSGQIEKGSTKRDQEQREAVAA